ncbi:MAG: hypothetical protein GY820_39365 [Gammaproteobacteria bacterium]|nr:hypothetical protein [Gammaproteobacteria bacterium]
MDTMGTTEEAAIVLGLTERKLLNLCKRYPHLTPSGRFGSALVWVQDDIQRVIRTQNHIASGLCARCGMDPADDTTPDPIPTEPEA